MRTDTRDLLATCKPLGDRVVVKRDPAGESTPGGVLLVRANAPKEMTGTVVSVGPGARDANGVVRTPCVKPGDRVIITGYAGLAVDHGLSYDPDRDYVILREEDVLAILPKEGEDSV